MFHTEEIHERLTVATLEVAMKFEVSPRQLLREISGANWSSSSMIPITCHAFRFEHWKRIKDRVSEWVSKMSDEEQRPWRNSWCGYRLLLPWGELAGLVEFYMNQNDYIWWSTEQPNSRSQFDGPLNDLSVESKLFESIFCDGGDILRTVKYLKIKSISDKDITVTRKSPADKFWVRAFNDESGLIHLSENTEETSSDNGEETRSDDEEETSSDDEEETRSDDEEETRSGDEEEIRLKEIDEKINELHDIVFNGNRNMTDGIYIQIMDKLKEIKGS